MKLGKIQVESAGMEVDEKKAKQRQQNYRRAYIMGKALVDAGDERAGLKIINDATNNLVVNGYGAQIIHRSDNPENPIWKKDFAKDANILVNTPEHGIMGFKDAKSALKIVEGLADPEGFFEYEKQQRTKIDDLNTAERPYQNDKGEWVKRVHSITNSGRTTKIVAADPNEVQMSVTRQKIEEAKKIKGGPLTESETNIIMGLTKPEGATEAESHRADAALKRKQAAELGKGGGKKDLEKTKQQREIWAKDLKIVLEPFASKGKPTLDPETGEMTQAGENALKAARALVVKAEDDPNSLTKEEKRNLEHAKRADQLHTAISRAIGANYGEQPAGPGKVDKNAAKAELKRRGYVEDASGNMVKPSKSAPETKQAASSGKGEGLKSRNDGRPPGISIRKWNAMSDDEKKATQKKYRDDRKTAVAGTRG
jgi:hypothetical protein